MTDDVLRCDDDDDGRSESFPRFADGAALPAKCRCPRDWASFSSYLQMAAESALPFLGKVAAQSALHRTQLDSQDPNNDERW